MVSGFFGTQFKDTDNFQKRKESVSEMQIYLGQSFSPLSGYNLSEHLYSSNQ
jgi:hypothetical protein